MSTNPWDDDPISGQEKPSTIAGTVSQQPAKEKTKVPEIIPQEAGVEQNDPLFTYKDDPLESIGPGEMLTRAKVNAATAQNSAIRAALSKAKPTGKMVQQPGGGSTWVPDPIEPPPVVGNVGQATPSETVAISNIQKRMAGADPASIAADAADQEWRRNAEGELAVLLGQGDGKDSHNLGKSYVSLLGQQMERVRAELVKEAYPRSVARQIAFDSAVKAFNTNFRVNPQGDFGLFQLFDQQVAPINDRLVLFGGDGSGDPMTDEQILAQKEKERDPEDRNRGWWSGLWNGGADEVTPADMIAHPGFKNVLNESVGKLPNPFTKKKDYEAGGEAWALQHAGTDAQGIANFIGSTEEKVKQKLAELMFLEDIRQNGVQRGYAMRLKSGEVVRATINQDEIDSVIVPQIESLKKALTGVR